MAQPAGTTKKHIAGVSIKAGKTYNTADLLAIYTTVNIVIMKTKVAKNDTDITVSVNGTDAFPIEYNEESYIETGKTFLFNKDCTVVLAELVAVA